MLGEANDRARGDGLGCDDARLLLSAAQDGEVDEATEGRLARHLARCGACARHHADLVELEGALARAAAYEAEVAGAPGWEAVGAFVSAGRPRGDRALRESRRLLDRKGSLMGHPLARAVAAVLVVIGGYVAARGFLPDRFTPRQVEEAARSDADEPGRPAEPAALAEVEGAGGDGGAPPVDGAAISAAVRRAAAAAERGIESAPALR